MLSNKQIENTLWVSGFIGQLALLLILALRRCAKDFPVFTARIVFLLAVNFVLFYTSRYRSANDYFRVYWIVAFFDYIFQLAVIYEMASRVFRPAGSWIIEARRPFLIWSAVSLIVAAGIGAAIRIPGLSGINLYSIQANVATSILTCGVFLSMSLSGDRLALQWTDREMAIGEGLTFWNLTTLIEQIAHLVNGWNQRQRAYDDVSTLAYVLSLLFWCVAFSLAETKRPPLSNAIKDRIVPLHDQTMNDLEEIERIKKHLKRDKRADL